MLRLPAGAAAGIAGGGNEAPEPAKFQPVREAEQSFHGGRLLRLFVEKQRLWRNFEVHLRKNNDFFRKNRNCL